MTPSTCECGCGQITSIAKDTNTKRGHIKGQHVRFVVGHNRRVQDACTTPAARLKSAAARTGRKLGKGPSRNAGTKNPMYGRRGKRSTNWRGGNTTANEMARKTVAQIEWAKEVKRRDNYTCQECGKRGGGRRLHSHHIKSFAKYPESRLDLDNGITLCKKCHRLVHKKVN